MLIARDEITGDTWQARRLELLLTSRSLPAVVLNRSASWWEAGRRRRLLHRRAAFLFYFSLSLSLLVLFPAFEAPRVCVLQYSHRHHTITTILKLRRGFELTFDCHRFITGADRAVAAAAASAGRENIWQKSWCERLLWWSRNFHHHLGLVLANAIKTS